MKPQYLELVSRIQPLTVLQYFLDLGCWHCHKKSYLICDKITNFRIFMQPIPNLFSKYKTETAKTGLRQLLEKK